MASPLPAATYTSALHMRASYGYATGNFSACQRQDETCEPACSQFWARKGKFK